MSLPLNNQMINFKIAYVVPHNKFYLALNLQDKIRAMVIIVCKIAIFHTLF